MQAKIVEEMSSNLGHRYFFLSGTKAYYQTLSSMTFYHNSNGNTSSTMTKKYW